MDNSVNVLYITYDGLSDPLGQSQILPYLYKLSDKGYKFTILSFEKKANYISNKEAIKKKLDEYNIKWHPLFFSKNPPVLSKFWDIYKLFKTTDSLVNNNNFSLIHCRSYVSSLPALKIKKTKGIPFVFDMRGFWADERLEGNIWNKKNPIYNWAYNYFIKKEKEFVENCNALVSLTDKGINLVEKRHETNISKKAFVIRTCVDEVLFNNSYYTDKDRLKIRKSITNNENSFILVYAGSIGTWYMLHEMLVFFEYFLKTNPESRFLILTKTEPNEIYKFVKTELKDKIIIRSVNYAEMPLYLSSCDYGMYFIKNLWSKQASTPVKLAEMAACGLPVVANAIGDMEELFNKYYLGKLIYDFNETSMKSIINEIICEHKQRVMLPSEFTVSYGADIYNQVYLKAIKKAD